LQQPEFEVKALLLLPAEFAVRAQHDLQKAGQVFFAELFGHTRHSRAFIGRNLQQRRFGAGDLGHHRVAQEADQLAREVRRALALGNEAIDQAEHVFAGVARHRAEHLLERLGGDRAGQPAHGLRGDLAGGRGDGLVHDAERVAQGAVAGLGEHGEGGVVSRDCFASGDVAQLAHDFVELHGVEAEVLRARADGLGNVFRLRGGHHEDNVAGRLLERFQQRVEGGVGDLVRLVEDVDLVAVARRAVSGRVPQLADFVDAAVGGGVDFDHVHRTAFADLDARFALAARLRDWFVTRPAVQRHRQNERHRRLADAAMSAEDIAVRDALLGERVPGRRGDVRLADDVGKFLWAVLPGQHLVAHRRKLDYKRFTAATQRAPGNSPLACGAWHLAPGLHLCGAKHYRFALENAAVEVSAAREVAMPLKLSSRSVRGVIVVDCAGRIVFGDEAAILREELKKLLQHNRSIVLNLSNVGYIDSGGLGTLVGIYTSARNLGGQIKLAGLNS